MKTPAIIAACLFSATISLARNGVAPQPTTMGSMPLQFITNKGQITDQYGKPRRDIDYKLSGGEVTLFIGDGQLHYQWSNKIANTKTEIRNTKLPDSKKSPSGDVGVESGAVTIYRMDVELLGADKNAVVVAEDIQPYYENYYLPTVPDGATVHSYRKITYKNVYPQIDWVLYTPTPPEGGLPAVGTGMIKYDFVVHPGGNVAAIQLQYNGATRLELKDGALIATTPYGSITEEAPYSYMAETGQTVNSRFVLQGNVLSYATATNENTGTLVIDPSLKWGTYLGFEATAGTGTLIIEADTAGNAYIFGNVDYAQANIATTGAHQTSYSGGAVNGFIVKFSKTGSPLWGTYYGGNNSVTIADGHVSFAGDVFIAGHTYSNSGIATSGAYQTSLPATSAGFMAKFNTAGVRQWGSYYGDSTNINSICTDDGSNVCISGVVGSSTSNPYNYATAGTFSTAPIGNGFLAKFNSSGTSRIWGTYYYLSGTDIVCDGSNNIYMCSATTNVSGWASTGAHQTSFGGGTRDGHIAKFSATGNRLWATYYGGSALDYLFALDCDAFGNVYVAGTTQSTNAIATAGSHQSGNAGGWDGFVVKFNPAGTRLWGTYYGGSSTDLATSVSIGDDQTVYISGTTNSTTNIATAGSHQTTLGNPLSSDMFMTAFNTNGLRLYGTYYGGFGAEGYINANDNYTLKTIACGGYGKVYIGNHTAFSATGIATTGAYRTSILTAGSDGFLAMFESDTNLYIPIPFADTVVCSGDTLSIPYGVTQSFRSSNNFIFELSNTSGSFASGVTTIGTLTGAQHGGTYHWVVPHSTAQSNAYRVRIRSTGPVDTANMEYNIRITTTPQSVNATHNTPICSGNTINLGSSTATSGVSYSWAGPNSYSSNLQNPSITNAQVLQSGNYMVTFTNNGCISKDTAAVVVNLTPVTPVAGSNGPLCAGSTLQLTATSSSPGAAYNWSGPAYSSTSQNPAISSVTTANSGSYSVYATLGSCTSATTTTNVSVVNGPTINFYPSPNDTVCGSPAGSATLVAVPANPGSSPQYQWYKNGTMIPGATSTNYVATGISTGDSYYVVLTPGAGAACTTPISSNSITMTVMPFITPTVSISANPNTPVPSGTLISFTAVATDAGTKPTYQWKLNGVPQGGATSSVWSAATFSNNDKVSCEVTSSYICPQPQKVTSNEVVVKLTTGITGVWSGTTPDIYPNPAKDKLIIEGISKGTRIQLIDVLGRTVINRTATQETEVLNTAHLIPGNYILQLSTEQGERMRVKITKE